MLVVFFMGRSLVWTRDPTHWDACVEQLSSSGWHVDLVADIRSVDDVAAVDAVLIDATVADDAARVFVRSPKRRDTYLNRLWITG